MLTRMRILLILGLPCLTFSLGIDAAAQVGRLAGTVAYAAPGYSSVVAKGVKVIVVGNYTQVETRTDNNGNFVLVLRAGDYSVYAQGAPGYIQYQEVRGYVRPNINSIINPNPLFLVPQSRRSSGSLTSLALSQAKDWSESAIAAYPKGLIFKIAGNSTTGNLIGSVKYKQKIDIPVPGVLVTAEGGRRKASVRTNLNGEFVMKSLPIGQYDISVEAPPRFKQEMKVVGEVVKGRNDNFVSPNPILLIPK